MMTPCIKKEILLLLRDGKVVFASALLLLMLLVLAISSMAQHQAREEEKRLVGESAREQWDKQGVKHPHRGAHFGIYVFRPNTALAAVEPGVLPFTGQSLWLEPHRRNMTRFSEATDAGPAQRLVDMAPAFILYGLFPLLILSLALNQIPQEREDGTLRMLHSAGFSPSTLIFSKLVAQWVLIGAVLLPAVLTAIFICALTGQGEICIRIVLLTFAYGFFYIVIGALGLAVGMLVRSVRAGQLLAVVIWAVAIVLVPRLANAAAQVMVPLPHAADFWAAIEREYTDGPPDGVSLAERVAGFEASLLQQYGVDDLNDVPIGVNAARRLFRDAYADEVYEKHFSRLWALYANQQQILQCFAVVSPVIAIRNISMTLSGSSLADQKHFEAASETYRRHVNTTIDEWDLHHTQGIVSFEVQYSDADLWQSIGTFSYVPLHWTRSVSHALPDFFVLLGWVIFAGLVLKKTARRLVP